MWTVPPWLKKGYWVLAGLGAIWAMFLSSLLNPTAQGQYVYDPASRLEHNRMLMIGFSAMYMHRVHTGFWHNASNPEEFGFASMVHVPDDKRGFLRLISLQRVKSHRFGSIRVTARSCFAGTCFRWTCTWRTSTRWCRRRRVVSRRTLGLPSQQSY
jgi:hypothetical protein